MGIAAVAQALRHPTCPTRPAPPRLVLASACLAAYGILPLAFTSAVVEADAHSLATLRDPAHRVGRPVGFDRVWLERMGPGRGRIVRGEEALEISGVLPERSGRVSARGAFRDVRSVELHDVHLHDGVPRSLASYLGLALVAGLWAIHGVASRRRPPPRS